MGRSAKKRPPAVAGAMKIARLSEAAQVSKSTIHNYVRIGLLPPPEKVGLNVHLYSPHHLTRLQEIRALREEGNLSIEQILETVHTKEFAPPGPRSPGDTTEEGPGDVGGPAGETNDKHQQIVDTAIELFNRLGYERVRISDITESLNMGKGTFYLYFSNKEELLLECFKRLASIIVSFELRPNLSDAHDFFSKTRPRFVTAQAQYSKLAGIMNLIRTGSLSSDQRISHRAKESYDAIIAPLRMDLERAIDTGLARKVDSELAVYSLVGTFDNLCYRGTIDDRYAPEEVADFMQDLVEHALRARGPCEDRVAATAPFCTLTDRDGTRVTLENLRFDGRPSLPAALGKASVEVDAGRIASIAFSEVGPECQAEVRMNDGAAASLHVAGDVMISGESALGTIRIALRNVSELSFGQADRFSGSTAPSALPPNASHR